MADFADLDFREPSKQDVREYWAHEAQEFTPWLADQIQADETSHLEDVLGLELEMVEIKKESVNTASIFLRGSETIAATSLSRINSPHLTTTISGKQSPMPPASTQTSSSGLPQILTTNIKMLFNG